ncbi:hypothetical protein ATY81_10485 [Rhizobium sp. R72]|uniref:hypothetical protein n=1 Tax=unclassified Rhizobium TaxID=2613769 RepID=UPI000B5382D0|nr:MULTISPECIES: hypothetical protein [unclassified Rhizobium]OWV86808.1 hypothetical protein ATY79_08300 [Rhizobium sp. R693]OWV95584.1 hypothetical protein ATY81_10485 [Rhizobium sp. R72]OWV95884.1 hypothetical protein ATY80_10485 [Rhizobium sp. R711]
MSQYHETRRFKCTSDAGNACVVIEQIRIADEAVAGPRTDYMTVDGDVANRLDKKHFLILMKGEIVKIQRALRKKH